MSQQYHHNSHREAGFAAGAMSSSSSGGRAMEPAADAASAATTTTLLPDSCPTEVLLSYHTLQTLQPSSYLLPSDRNSKRQKTGAGSRGFHRGDQKQGKKGNDEREAGRKMYRTMYGLEPSKLPFSTQPGEEICAGCYESTSADDSVVLLCDGQGCSREYHLSCCLPPLKKVPSGTWYCRDCSPTGSTRTLKDYLDRVDEFRHYIIDNNLAPSPSPSSSYRQSQKAVIDSGLYSAAHAVGFPNEQVPQSELEILDTLQHTADQEVDVENVENPSPPAKLGPSYLVGKPIQLYVQDEESELIHSGRIVDFRVIGDDGVVMTKSNSPIFSSDVVIEYLGKRVDEQRRVPLHIPTPHNSM